MIHEHFDLFYIAMVSLTILALIGKFMVKYLIFRLVHGRGRKSIGKYIEYKVQEKEMKLNRNRKANPNEA